MTNTDRQTQDQFSKYAELCVKSARETMDIQLGYDAASIPKLDSIIDDIGRPTNIEQMVTVLGAFLGEALCKLYAGRWAWDEQYGAWGVVLRKASGGEEMVFPFAKIQKRFENGMEDSITFFAKVVDSLARSPVLS